MGGDLRVSVIQIHTDVGGRDALQDQLGATLEMAGEWSRRMKPYSSR